MNNQNLIIYQFNSLYQILKELEKDLNFSIIESLSEKSLHNKIKNLDNYLVITKKKNLEIENKYIFDELPIKIFKFIEKLNIKFLKQQFIEQSDVKINNYLINLNSREISSESEKLKLTEKEINIIIYLSKLKKPINVDELQTNVWGYQAELDTHTVETHIYRLRKKISKVFKDENFIISKKNGYQIN
tara:strand:- start:2367 stop:2930 length:564 start_codon:yes stop_codon:yes gene_type:complete